MDATSKNAITKTVEVEGTPVRPPRGRPGHRRPRGVPAPLRSPCRPHPTMPPEHLTSSTAQPCQRLLLKFPV
jgi:hypothetical protein